MFLFLSKNLIYGLFSFSSILAFVSDYRYLFYGIGIVGLIYFAIKFLFRKRKKKRNGKEVVRPVTDILGSNSEQLEELNNDLEPFGFAYDPNQDIFYSNMICWQRDFGYCRLYDEACAPLSMIIDCEPIRFEYNGLKWMIEFWKGQYGMTTGGEVGIYYTKGPDLNIPGIFNGTFYHCVKDEDRIPMSFAFRKNGNLLFTRTGYHWWLTGFKLGEFSDPSELTMDIVLELYDRTMCNAFVAALKKAGYKNNEYTVSGRRVNIHFTKPHTKQPFSRTSLTEYIMQRNNEALCSSYQYLTEEYVDTLDKLEIVRNKSPKMYRNVLNLGKSPQVFEAFHRIRGSIKSQDPFGEE